MPLSLQIALTYNEALLSGRLANSKGGIVQSIFLGSLRKRMEEILKGSDRLKDYFHNYLELGRWPHNGSLGERSSIPFSWYLKWFGVPAPSVIKAAVSKLKPKISSSCSVPLLCLLLPSTHVSAIDEIDKYLVSSDIDR